VPEAEKLSKGLAEVIAAVPPGWREHAQVHDPALSNVLALASGDLPRARSLPALFLHMPAEAWRVWRGLRHARPIFLERVAYRNFSAQLQELRRLRIKLQFHKPFKRFMSMWRSLHVVLAIVLLALIATHVWVSVRVGFRWLWR
jgi:hypothetical protein